MKKILSISTVALLALTLSGCANSNGNSSSSSSNVSSDVNNSSSSGSSVNPENQKSNVTYDQFASVKLGTHENDDGISKNGDTAKEVSAKLGKPTTIDKSSDLTAGPAYNYVWYNPKFSASKITISFSVNKRAMKKVVTALPLEKLKATVTLYDPHNYPYFKPKTINLNGKSFSNGDSYDDVVKHLGVPASETIVNGYIRIVYVVSVSQKNGVKVVTLDFNQYKLENIDVMTRSYGVPIDE